MNHIREKMLLYSFYDVSKTLNENLILIDEQSTQYIQPKQTIDNTFVQKKDYKIDSSGFPKVNLKGTEKPEEPKPVLSVGSPGFTPRYSYRRYEGDYAKTFDWDPFVGDGYTTYQFDKKDLPKYTKLYSEDLKRWEERHDPIGDFMIEHYHGLMDVASLGLSFLGPWGLIAALAVDLANAAIYAGEGDKYEAGLRVMFALIPGHQLMNQIRAAKNLGPVGLKQFVKKLIGKGTLNSEEKVLLNELERNSKWLKLEMLRQVLKRTLPNFFKKIGFTKLVEFMWRLSKKYPKLSWLVDFSVTIAGVEYTWGKLAAIFGITESDKNTQENDRVRKKIESDMAKNYDKFSEEFAEHFVEFIRNDIESQTIIAEEMGIKTKQ